MTSERVQNLLNDIEITISNIHNFVGINQREKSYLAQYLAVYICGTYEECIKNTITLWAQTKCSPEIVSFIDKYLYEHFRNPDSDRVIELLQKFNSGWADEIQKMSKIIKDALDSIVLNKNHIARGQKSEITLNDIDKWYPRSKQIILKIDQLLLEDSL